MVLEPQQRVSFLLCRTLGEQVCFPGLLREVTEKNVTSLQKLIRYFHPYCCSFAFLNYLVNLPSSNLTSVLVYVAHPA